MALILAGAVLAIAACACGAGSGPPATGAGPGTPSAAASRVPGAIASPETGSQLKALLPTQAELPRGWALSQGTGQEADSGAALTRSPYFPTLPRMSCAQSKGVDPQFLLSDEQASYAQLTAVIGDSKNTSLGSVNLAGFYPGWAVRQFALISSFARQRCGPFTKHDEITGALVRMKPTVTAVPGPGDQALLIKIVQTNGPLPDGTYYPGDYLLVIRAGNYIADIDAPAIPGQPEAAAVTDLASMLARRLRQLN